MPDNSEKILLAHGGGGQLTEQLIREIIQPNISQDNTSPLNDSAEVETENQKVLFTTDSYVVKPLFFKGGDIGKLSVCGTINDLAVCGAQPKAISLALIIQEGFEIEKLELILKSIGETAKENNVRIVTGDTKTVESNAAEGVYINTAGIGDPIKNVNLGFDCIKEGDKIIINGTLGDHGMTIMSQREEIGFQSELESDCAGLAKIICPMLKKIEGVNFLRDLTRGGLAMTINEIAENSGFDIELEQKNIPVKPAVQAAADVLGMDVLNIANEGKFVALVSDENANEFLEYCRRHPLGKNAAVIGEVKTKTKNPIVELRTAIEGKRIVQPPYGQDLPRIC
jgi:hydrogenase expression/formation protein HypE